MSQPLEPESPGATPRRQKNAMKQRLIEIVFAGIFVLAFFASIQVTTHTDSKMIAAASILLPALSITAWFGFCAYQISKLREFERHIATQAIAIVFGLIIWGTTIWGLCVALLDAPHFPLAALAPLSAAGYSLARFIISVRYK